MAEKRLFRVILVISERPKTFQYKYGSKTANLTKKFKNVIPEAAFPPSKPPEVRCPRLRVSQTPFA
jgi:hypothetical protein